MLVMEVLHSFLLDLSAAKHWRSRLCSCPGKSIVELGRGYSRLASLEAGVDTGQPTAQCSRRRSSGRQFLLPEGQEGFLGLLDYWADDPMDLLTCAIFRKLYLKRFRLSRCRTPEGAPPAEKLEAASVCAAPFSQPICLIDPGGIPLEKFCFSFFRYL
jgi:hypothetical protein